MTVYYVGEKEFMSLKSAKAEMRETGLGGTKVKVYADGEWIPCGEIKLNGSNRCRIVGARNSNQY